jgi:predicted ATP-dependent endonuclease of OLD family
MELQAIEIENFRSIEKLYMPIKKLGDSSYTFGLIGINEAGKSSILKAITLESFVTGMNRKDFGFDSKNIHVHLHYQFNKEEQKILRATVLEHEKDIEKTKLEFDKVIQTIELNLDNSESIHYYSYKPIDDYNNEVEDFLRNQLDLWQIRPVFWTSEPRYLISGPINLTQFAASPSAISIPLTNCFYLAGILDIPGRISQCADDSTEVEHLQNQLGDAVTEHISKVWPNHPIRITFQIVDGYIHFHVRDIGSKSKAKTADQRSDGFKQFVSFLLTVSAQAKNGELANTILLLDEPETHLHPQAQEFLLQELIKITQNRKGNIVLFATHSNYMIDKNDLSRNFKVEKSNDRTVIHQFDSSLSSFASVNYEVFGIATSDYHNELFGKIQEREGIYLEKEFDDYLESKGIKKNLEYTRINKDKTEKKYKVTLPTKVRNLIHHPENKKNTIEKNDLINSIEILRKLF